MWHLTVIKKNLYGPTSEVVRQTFYRLVISQKTAIGAPLVSHGWAKTGPPQEERNKITYLEKSNKFKIKKFTSFSTFYSNIMISLQHISLIILHILLNLCHDKLSCFKVINNNCNHLIRMFFINLIGWITAVIYCSAMSRANVDHVSKTHHSILPFLILRGDWCSSRGP